ncbi:aspartate carbamoyltransferase [Thermaerobacter marianensis DSM 12885]|uniref:Aspartate carbamoyltransferase n=1 Tax=Thermaerobacter marianensis (strain ATCC 700841 / DSM 12885 / JCM 10246 / 7p75a) TaxID=644966 RepID=E6SJH8_THEM7|nr:aspartate carbamoyltransferase catalytic subunit [Thermaerobacter marianensis]ADU52133.1 aspartate carbamoyltransferase [Thermaerobacter marianensis DSM 12885]
MLTGTTPQSVSPAATPPHALREAARATRPVPLPVPIPSPSPVHPQPKSHGGSRTLASADPSGLPAAQPGVPPAPPGTPPGQLDISRPRSLTGIATLADPDLEDLLARAIRMMATLEARRDAGLDPAPLQGRRVVTLFYENSTRTSQSFHVAAHLLGAAAFDLPVARSSVQKGESLRDTLRTCAALGFDAVILRHPVTGAAAYAASVLDVPVINAGDGTGEHPTQALLDALTILRHKGRLAGLKVAIVGDVRHSRVARSNALLLSRLGAEVWLCGPPGLLPSAPPRPGVTVTARLDEALADADVVMALRIQRERLGGVLPDLAEYRRGWGIGPRQLAWARPGAILMHPGPVNRGIELDPELMEDPRCVIEEQVACGVAARMAVLEWALGGPATSAGAAEGAEPAPGAAGAVERAGTAHRVERAGPAGRVEPAAGGTPRAADAARPCARPAEEVSAR